MVTKNQSELEIKIQLDSVSELYDYKQSILSLLRRVEVDRSDAALLKDLKNIYRLLNHFCKEDLNHPDQ